SMLIRIHSLHHCRRSCIYRYIILFFIYHSFSCNLIVFFFNYTATTEIYTLSLHDALPIWPKSSKCNKLFGYSFSTVSTNRSMKSDRKSTRLNSSHVSISYAVFCLKKKNKNKTKK